MPLHLRTHGGGAIHLHIIERREGCNYGNSKSLLPGDEIVGEHAPGALRVTDPHGARKAVDRCGKLQAIFENFVGEGLRNLDPAGAAVIALRSVG